MGKVNLKDLKLLPNLVSLSRIILSIIFSISFYYNPHSYIPFISLVLGGISDFLDGFLARKLKRESQLGLYLDPIADKIMIILVAFTLYLTNDLNKYLLLALILRDTLIILGGIVLIILRKGEVKPLFLGKLHTAIYIILFGFLVLKYLIPISVNFIKYFTDFAVLITLLSFLQYLIHFYNSTKDSN